MNRRSLPRCTSSLSREASSRAISVSGEAVLPRRSEMAMPDSIFTRCHSRVLTAWAVAMGEMCMDRSMGRPRARTRCM